MTVKLRSSNPTRTFYDSLKSSYHFKKAAELFKKDPKNFVRNIINEFSPESLDLHLVTAGLEIKNNVECWFSGECVLIRFSLFQKMLDMMMKEDPSSVNVRYHYNKTAKTK